MNNEPQLSFQFDFLGLLFLISLGLAYLVVLWALDRKFRTLATWASLIKKYAPLVVVFVPAFITYFCFCGAGSAIVVYLHGYFATSSEDLPNQTTQMMCHGVEYLCSFILPIVYFKILDKLKMDYPWALIIVSTHVLVAGYRDAKLIPERHETGPEILDTFGIIDGLIPLLSLLFFFCVLQRNKRNVA